MQQVITLFLLTAALARPLQVANAAKSATLPASFPRCNITLPKNEYQECLIVSIQKAFHLIATKGISKLGVLPIDPLEVSEISIGEGGGAVRLQLILSKVSLQGLNGTRLLNASNEIPQGGAAMRAEIVIPRLEIISDYLVDGHILLLPIKGKGPSNITLEHVKVNVAIENEITQRGSEDYLKIKSFKASIRPEHIRIHLENLFGGDPILGTHMARFILDNSAEVYKELQEPIEQAFSQIFSAISSRIFDQVPYKTIFLH